MTRIVLGVTMLSLTACFSQATPIIDPTPWESRQVLFQDAKVIREKVSYRSSNLNIFGQVCHPNRSGKFPVLIWNHGGFDGLKDGDEKFCEAFAGFGYTFLMSSYRGEDGSEGSVEVCQGEVDDVLKMLELGRKIPFANPNKVAVLGGSHGGCISLQAVQKGAPAQALIVFYAPSNWIAEYQQVQRLLNSSDPTKKYVGQILDSVATKALGGTPTTVPQQYLARSPDQDVSSLSNWSGSILMLHGVQDWFVLPSQSCNLAKAVGGFSSFHLNAANTSSTIAPADCENAGLSWSANAVPRGNWQGKRYLMVYDEMSHGDGNQYNQALFDSIDFIFAKVPTP
jgi:dienelactone hydrolase